MRCKHCSTTWKLSGSDDGPVGKAAPGHFMIVVVILAATALGLGLWLKSIGGLAIGSMSVLFFVMAVVGCGVKPKQGQYQGSQCPECNEQNRIMPWDF